MRLFRFFLIILHAEFEMQLERSMKKRIFSGLLLGFMSIAAMAQVSNTLSPYSQFGLGVLSEQSQGFNHGMSGLAIGMRNGKIVNVQNPAS